MTMGEEDQRGSGMVLSGLPMEFVWINFEITKFGAASKNYYGGELLLYK